MGQKALRIVIAAVVTLLANFAWLVVPFEHAPPVRALTAASVSITFTPNSGGVSGLAITYVSDTQLDLAWSLGPTAAKVMIRAKYGGYPADIPDEFTAPSDGYLVYYGVGTTVSDVSINFDENPGPIYYRAWGQRGDGTWMVAPAQASEESRVMTFLVFALLPLVLTAAMFIAKGSKAMMLGFPAAIFWAVLCAYCYLTATTKAWTDIRYVTFFAAGGLAIFCVIAPFAFGERANPKAEGDVEDVIDGEPEPLPKSGKEREADGETEGFDSEDDEYFTEPSARTRELRDRARKRRTAVMRRRNYKELE